MQEHHHVDVSRVHDAGYILIETGRAVCHVARCRECAAALNQHETETKLAGIEATLQNWSMKHETVYVMRVVHNWHLVEPQSDTVSPQLEHSAENWPTVQPQFNK